MINNPFSLDGKTILVTGASSGIGRSTAVECSKMGAKLVITGRNEGRLKETMDMLIGEDHKYIVADLTRIEEIENLVSQLPVINGLVNNAGLNIVGLVQFIKQDDLFRIIDSNLNAPILLTNKLVKNKKISKGGSIVFTSSIGKSIVAPGNSMYAATKGGLSAFMKNAALELAAKSIRCNAVLPGMVETPLKSGKNTITEEQWEINRQLYPLKRFGLPEDVAYAIIFLLSDASAWVTGVELVIDGGRSLK